MKIAKNWIKKCFFAEQIPTAIYRPYPPILVRDILPAYHVLIIILTAEQPIRAPQIPAQKNLTRKENFDKRARS